MSSLSSFSSPTVLPSIVVSSQDAERLQRLLDALPHAQRDAASGLESELARADVLPAAELPHDVVTMNSRVLYEDVESGARRETVLTYPHEADAAQARVSILAPVGSALLGLRPGQEILWPLPSGRRKRIRVLRILYQPEAAGDWHL